MNNNKVVKSVGFNESVSKPDFDMWEEERIKKMIEYFEQNRLPVKVMELEIQLNLNNGINL